MKKLRSNASNSVIYELGKFFKKGMGFTFMVGIVLMSQVFSNYITAINHLDIENS